MVAYCIILKLFIMNNANLIMSNANREMVFERVFNAPAELVFEAWTNPDHLARWYGPDGFTLTTYHMDVKPGGTWRFTMHGPDGRDYHNLVTFTEVIRPQRLVYKQTDDTDTERVNFETTVTFEGRGDKTALTMHMLFATAAELERVAREHGAVEGAHQTLARLAVLLAGFVGAGEDR